MTIGAIELYIALRYAFSFMRRRSGMVTLAHMRQIVLA